MNNISFAWTTAALLAGRKTVTRREWTDDYGNRFKKGDLLAAYDRSPRFKGKQIGVIRLTAKPFKQKMSIMPDCDYEGEGFAFFDENPHLIPKVWLKTFKDYGINTFKEWFRIMKYADGGEMWVVPFEVVSL